MFINILSIFTLITGFPQELKIYFFNLISKNRNQIILFCIKKVFTLLNNTIYHGIVHPQTFFNLFSQRQ